MRLPTRLPAHHPAQKWLAALVIAFATTFVATAARYTPGSQYAMERGDNVLYDALYHRRTPEDRTRGDVVILAVDQKALDDLNGGLLKDEAGKAKAFGWPWPRMVWGQLVPYLERHGAKAVVFDLLFEQVSIYDRWDDDQELGDAVDGAKVPVVFGTYADPNGRPGTFAPKVAAPKFGAVNYAGTAVEREYTPVVNGMPSLALRAVTEATGRPPDVESPGPFRLHFYGPHRLPDGRYTFPYLSVGRVIAEAVNENRGNTPAGYPGFDPELFRGKIVLVGGITVGLQDLKSSPLSDVYPGVEVQATAVQNLLNRQRAHPVPPTGLAALTLGCTFLSALGVVLPRQAWLKLLWSSGVLGALLVAAVLLFRGQTIRWLPLAVPLFALTVTVVVAFAWSYLTEGRARQLLFRALSQSLSPEMADEVLRNPGLLGRLGGSRREMTVMFTDIAGFTDLSETMEVEDLTELMTYYLEEMSSVVLQDRAYLDKYIGDAIMSFWNGVIDQADHAALACRAALDMQRRERDIQPELARRGATKLLTRIGVNTGPMAMGNMGSSRKFAFTVLGDSVNLGSRLEGANKLYGSQIMLAQTTADLVRGKFVMRQLDLLRVKGKKKPMAVFELLADVPADPALADPALGRRVEQYEAGLKLYQQQRWDEAEAAFGGLFAEFPDDGPAKAMLDRVGKLRHNPPGPDWDGVYVAKDK